MVTYLYLTPESIPMLAKCLLAIVVTGYISIFFEKTKPVKWFIGYLIGYTLLDIFALVGEIILVDWSLLSLPLQYLASIGFTFCYLQFAYHFRKNNFTKEQRRVTIVVTCFTIPVVLYSVYLMFQIGFGDYTIIQALLPYPLLLICWSAVVFHRKYKIALKEDTQNETDASANKSFFIITVLAIIISITPALRALELIGHALFTVSFFILNLTVFCMLTASAVNYLANQTTVLVKLVGISLVLFVTIIGLQGFLIIPDYEFQSGDNISFEERQEIHSQVVPFVWFLFGSSGIILSLFPVFFSRSVLLPLRRLLEGVDKVNKGNLNTEIPIWNQDEFGVVTKHFNSMASNLKKANNTLKEYTEGLEEKVKERTYKLQEKNELLRIQSEELERMQQFRSRLFQDISHELRTPITLISGPLQQMLKKQNLEKEEKEQLQLSLRNSNRLKQLVEQIIELNRLETNQLTFHGTEMDLSGKLNMIVQAFESLIKSKGLTIRSELSKKPVAVKLDEDKFEKIITNLISNAVKFTSEGGTISVQLKEKGGSVEIIITDTGMGIPKEKLPYIFDRYQTSAHSEEEYKEGLGVGLAITKEYVELHNGTIDVQSEKGKGTEFKITFPVLKNTNVSSYKYQPLDVEELTSVQPADSVSAGNSVLLVEDNSDMAQYVTSVLNNHGFITEHTEHGKAALEFLKESTPDLIISDIMMPEMDGMTFLKELRSQQKFELVPTIFLSARSDIEGKLEGFRLGVNDYLVKPFNPEELICRINNLLNFQVNRKETQLEISNDDSAPVNETFVRTLIQLVEDRMSDNSFNLEELADEVAMSRSTLYREIKRATGLSAGAFVKEIRLQKARQRLENKSVRTVSELSFDIGFTTPSYFTKQYQQRFGKKPSDYLTS